MSDEPKPRVYLAGPDVFLPNAVALARRKQAICARHGLVGLAPCDGFPEGKPVSAAEIFAGCIAMMQAADAIIAHLTPFRGISADPGTVFELGFMAALGKPLYGYTNVAAPLGERVAQSFGPVTRTPDGLQWDRDGMLVEDFGRCDNLMIDEALALFGERMIIGTAAPGSELTDLAAFERCVALLRDHVVGAGP